MKWFVMIYFLSFNSDGTQDTFVFNKEWPDEATCRMSILTESEIAKYVEGLMIAYQGVLPGGINKVTCINEMQMRLLLNQKNKQEGKRSL